MSWFGFISFAILILLIDSGAYWLCSDSKCHEDFIFCLFLLELDVQRQSRVWGILNTKGKLHFNIMQHEMLYHIWQTFHSDNQTECPFWFVTSLFSLTLCSCQLLSVREGLYFCSSTSEEQLTFSTSVPIWEFSAVPVVRNDNICLSECHDVVYGYSCFQCHWLWTCPDFKSSIIVRSKRSSVQSWLSHHCANC